MKYKDEISAGQRFAFGDNWNRFLRMLDESRIKAAEDSLRTMLEVETLASQSFLDVGSGSGLFSLAARRLGARVHSFDYDPRCVACTADLRRRYFPGDSDWVVEEGSVLDREYLATLGQFDVVYSWGVLHHTGAMWEALENVVPTVAEGGRLFVAMYNDQKLISKYWILVKAIFNASILGRLAMLIVHTPYLFLARYIVRLAKRRSLERGMSLWHDMIDWLGGYPFEVSKPEQVFYFLRQRGFCLRQLKTCGGRHGCNEFVFEACVTK